MGNINIPMLLVWKELLGLLSGALTISTDTIRFVSILVQTENKRVILRKSLAFSLY